jgi:hypothetical protein
MNNRCIYKVVGFTFHFNLPSLLVYLVPRRSGRPRRVISEFVIFLMWCVNAL